MWGMAAIDMFPLRRLVTVTPLGEMFLVARGRYLIGAFFADAHGRTEAPGIWAHPTDPVFEPASIQLRQYFDGTRADFDLPILADGNDFAQRVWAKMAQIPYGQTASYGQIAGALGNRHMARAVGHAVATNPLAIILPCHRVVGSGGRLGGYAWGEDRKRYLLELEAGARAAPVLPEGQQNLF